MGLPMEWELSRMPTGARSCAKQGKCSIWVVLGENKSVFSSLLTKRESREGKTGSAAANSTGISTGQLISTRLTASACTGAVREQNCLIIHQKRPKQSKSNPTESMCKAQRAGPAAGHPLLGQKLLGNLWWLRFQHRACWFPPQQLLWHRFPFLSRFHGPILDRDEEGEQQDLPLEHPRRG